MPAPSVATFSVAAKVAAHTAFRDAIDSGAGPGIIDIKTSDDYPLLSIVLNEPCGTVNGTTGVLTFSIPAVAFANDTGVAAYAEFMNDDGVVYLSMPVAVGTSPVSGFFVLNSATIVSGGTINVISATLG